MASGTRILSVLIGLTALIGCRRQPSQVQVRSDVRLLAVRLACRVGSGPDSADGANRLARKGDTVWVFPVVKLLVGDKPGETLFLANTSRIRQVGLAAGGQDEDWRTRGRISVWAKLKQDIAIDWYEVRPARCRYRQGESTRYRLAPIRATGWMHEMVVGNQVRRIAVRASYGRQTIGSAGYLTESSATDLPLIGPQPDTGVPGRLLALCGSLPYRPGSTTDQVLTAVAADEPSWVAAGLGDLGYRFPSTPSWPQIESLGSVLFQGYFRMGRLHDAKGRPVRLTGDMRPRRNDVVLFSASHRAGFVLDGRRRRGMQLAGVSWAMPLLTVGPGLAGMRTFSSLVLEFPYLLRRHPVKILRFEPREPALETKRQTTRAGQANNNKL